MIKGAGDMQGKLIYVVDDDLDMRESICEVLASSGYEVRGFNDGMDALHGMRSDTPILLITDLEMPRMSGAELIGRVRAEARLAHIPVLVVSASPHDSSGPMLRMGKPFDLHTLLARVECLLAA
jgi:DNA-binding response OmpR family regulator